MNDYEDHSVNANAIKSGWVMVLVVNLGLVLLSL